MSNEEIHELSLNEVQREQLREAARLTKVARTFGWIIVTALVGGIVPLIGWATYVQVQNHYTLRAIAETYGQTKDRVTVMWIGGKWDERENGGVK